MSLRSDLQITLSGLEEETARQLGNEIASIVRSESENLDLSGLERVVITSNYDEDLAALDRGTTNQQPTTATRNRHGTGMAMTPSVRRGDEWFSIVIIDASMMLGLISEDEAQQRLSAQVLVHELAHVDDHKVMASRWPGFLQPHLDEYEFPLITIIEKARSEYVATRLAAFASPATGNGLMEMLVDVVAAEPPALALEVDEYQNHRNLDLLWEQVIARIGFFMQSVGYAFGHLDGLAEDDPTAVSMRAALREVAGTAWGSLLPDLHDAIAELADAPAPWSGWPNYEPAAEIALRAMNALKVHPLRYGENGLWIKIVP